MILRTPSASPRAARSQARGSTSARGIRRLRYAATLLAALGLATAGLATASTAAADGPGVGTPWVASLGDSYISGEAGRWAGNSNNSSASVDALGGSAYYDNATRTAEQINRCHRSLPIQQPGEVRSVYVGNFTIRLSGHKPLLCT